MPAKRLVLAYSGGLDTSVAIRWLKDRGWDVIAFTVDLGEKKDLDAIQARALKIGERAPAKPNDKPFEKIDPKESYLKRLGALDDLSDVRIEP